MTDTAHFRRAATLAGIITAATIGGVAHADTPRQTAKYDSRSNTYCITNMVTGSIIPQRVCATRQQWIDRGGTIVDAKQVAAK